MKEKLSEQSKKSLTGRKIIRTSDTGVQIDDGTFIELDQDEIMHLNERFENYKLGGQLNKTYTLKDLFK